MTFSGLEKPTQMGITSGTHGIPPGIALEPGEFAGGLAVVGATRCGNETAYVIMDAGGVDETVPMLTGDFHGEARTGDDVPAIAAT